jgi:hypothetical protein
MNETTRRMSCKWPRASEIDGGVGWAAEPVGFDFDPTAPALRIRFPSMGRNRRLVRSAALNGQFDFRALFLFAHFLFGQETV